MIVLSRVLGEIDIDPSQLIHFPEGLPAFEAEKEFIIIPLEGGPYHYLQSVQDSDLCLLMTNPFIFFPDYQVELPDEQLKKLELSEAGKDLAVYIVLTIPEDFRKTTTNLLAPIIINVSRKIGLQFIPAKSDYKIRQPLFPATGADVSSTAREGL